MTVNTEAFQINLRRFIGMKGMTRKEFAKQSGISYKSLSNWCNGCLPTADNLAILADALGVKADDLLKNMIKK